MLRDTLLDSLAPGSVRWGHRLDTLDGQTLRFENGVTDTADLIVGADGAWSRVRPAVVDAEPRYAGISHVETGITEIDRRHPELAALWCLDDDRSLGVQRNGDGSVRIAMTFRVPEGWLSTVDPTAAHTQFADWAPELTALLRAADEPGVTRRIFALPIGLTWPSTPGRTLLGDAAHLMSPFAGQGADLALLDGAELGRTLAEGGDLREFEEAMWARARSAAEQSAVNLERMIAPGGIEATIAIVGPPR